MRRWIATLMLVGLAGCGCEETIKPEFPDARKNNEEALDAALARAGLARASVQIFEAGTISGAPSYVSEPTVVSLPALAAGKNVLLLPQADEGHLLARDAAGKFHVVSVGHEVTVTRHHKPCGCGPGAMGTAPPPPPIAYVVLDAPDALGPPVTIVARGWIDVDDTYPEANDRRCREIP